MWYFKGKPYLEIHNPDLVGFIYLITFTDPKTKNELKYIGKKQFFNKRTKKKGKRELAAMTDKRGSKKVVNVKESDWKNYQSSNTILKVQDPKDLKKEILDFCDSLSCLTYKETKLQFVHEVLENDEWLNGNILRRFFSIKK